MGAPGRRHLKPVWPWPHRRRSGRARADCRRPRLPWAVQHMRLRLQVEAVPSVGCGRGAAFAVPGQTCSLAGSRPGTVTGAGRPGREHRCLRCGSRRSRRARRSTARHGGRSAARSASGNVCPARRGHGTHA